MRPGKRLFDLFWSVLGVVLLWPLLAGIALAIKLGDGGPVFFRHARVGYRGKQFHMWKFRTMVPGASRKGLPLTVGPDPRITPVGRWLRRLKVDELPQLFNVIAGEMSLVGPRPEVPRYVERYTDQQRRVLELMPGITDVASIAYRNENEILARSSDPERTYIEQILPHKIELNLEYAKEATVWSDLRVILRTLLLLP